MTTSKRKHISRRFRRFARANEAVSALEYAILVGVIAVGTGAAVATFSGEISAALAKVGGSMSSVTTTTPVATT